MDGKQGTMVGPLNNERFSLVETEGEAVLLDLQSGRYIGLNSQAFFLWTCVAKDATTKASLVRLYGTAFGLCEAEASRHVDLFVQALHRKKLS